MQNLVQGNPASITQPLAASSDSPEALLIANVTGPVTSSVPSRPMTLANDRLQNRCAGKYDGYDSESDSYRNCCSVLNLDDWLREWLLQLFRPTSAFRPRVPDTTVFHKILFSMPVARNNWSLED